MKRKEKKTGRTVWGSVSSHAIHIVKKKKKKICDYFSTSHQKKTGVSYTRINGQIDV